MQAVIDKLQTAKGIIIFTGAGVSTSCGIPDYRSETGIYKKRLSFTREDINSAEYQNLVAAMTSASPSLTHIFCTKVYEMGKLIRVYTQNIDGLHIKAGLPQEYVVEMHGSIIPQNGDSDVVFFGEEIPKQCLKMIKNDLVDNVNLIDTVIVLGTTLQVYPFAALPNMVNRNCMRIFVNNDLSVIPRARKKYKPGQDDQMAFSYSLASSVTICGRKVSTKASWEDVRTRQPGIFLTKWKYQYLFESDCDTWVRYITEEPAVANQ